MLESVCLEDEAQTPACVTARISAYPLRVPTAALAPFCVRALRKPVAEPR